MRLATFTRLVVAMAATTILVVACSSSQSGSPSSPNPAAPTSLDASTTHDAGPSPQPQNDAAPAPVPGITELVVAIDGTELADQGNALDSLSLQVKIDGVVTLTKPIDLPVFPQPVASETHILAPAGKESAKVEVLIQGTYFDEKLTRSATTHFVKGKSLLAYLYLEPSCFVYGDTSPPDAVCTQPGDTCRAGKCRPDLMADPLPDYRADWATNPPPICGSNGGPPTIVLGRGETSFVSPILANETVDVTCGPQGGHHVWVALKIQNMKPFQISTRLSGIQTGTGLATTVSELPFDYQEVAEADCEHVGFQFVLDSPGVTPIEQFLGKPLDIKVEISAFNGGVIATTTQHVNVASTYSGIYCPTASDAGP